MNQLCIEAHFSHITAAIMDFEAKWRLIITFFRGRASKKIQEETKTGSNRKPLNSVDTNQKTIAFNRDATTLDSNETEYLHERFFGDVNGCKNCKHNQSMTRKRRFCAHVNHKYPLSLSTWSPWQKSKQHVSEIGHSTKTASFCKLMRFVGKAKDKHNGEDYEKRMKENFKRADVFPEG